MLINVATLVQEPIGHARRYYADGEVVDVDGFVQAVTGPIRLIRSERGVLVSASFDLDPVALWCDRCLVEFDAPLHIEFDEEYVIARDPTTGQRIETDGDDFIIDGAWHLDLSEAVRQYAESALPIRALCRPDCRGLCPTCGQNWNEADCGCVAAAADERWSALATLAERLRDGDEEEHHGAPEA